jgi:uncharacterized damage-inducible protein DinB
MVVLILSLISVTATAKADNMLSTDVKETFIRIRDYILKAADQMNEDQYSFRPSPEVRSYGQLLGHIADGQYLICSSALGEKDPALGIEKSQTTKAGIIKALKDAFAYCEKAHDGMKDADATKEATFFGMKRAKLSVLWINSLHNNEHYGNLVTYLRLKGFVPPSSQK